MIELRCPGCGASLKPPDDGKDSLVCTYCGTAVTINRQPPQPPPQPPPRQTFNPPTNLVVHVGKPIGDIKKGARSVVVIIVLFGFLVSAGIALTTYLLSKNLAGKLMDSQVSWDDTTPLRCSGNESISVEGRTITMDGGAAIIASGNCELRIENCHVSAKTVLQASGNAEVTFVNGSVTGEPTAFDMRGNSIVNVIGTTVGGEQRRGGNAVIR